MSPCWFCCADGGCRPNGTVVVVGLPKDPTVVAGAPPIMMALKRLNFVGSVVGSLKDVEEALEFTARDLVHVGEHVLNDVRQTDLCSQFYPEESSQIWMTLWRR